ncbi:potassium channel subfamily U member 1 [Spea bombifrons]|uniref:potassium channel subfamily U member 1 n=1 Tax=Spea bombifrons TaxID=233779 RepID=UPI00234AA77D|nr:potassium channel subfamily U member 1 [Spea bombifrons]
MTLSAQTIIGKILVIGVFALTIITVIIYFIMSTYPLESCDYPGKIIAAAEVLANGFFAFCFVLRFIAASDKLKFWLELNSIVDFLTIPPVCVLVYLGKNWLGLRFIRALRLLELPKILLLLKITKTSAAIKLSNLLAVFLSSWLTAAGFLHLLENTGDQWLDYDNSQRMNYLECIYMLMVTMSTVGYGDITAKTTLGRIFMIFFIVGGLALFASHAPEIVDIVGSTKKYNGTYVVMGRRKHVVVCGYITLDSVNSFLKDFMDRDKGRTSTEVIFMGEIIPNLELETLLKRYHAQTTFFYGSVLNVDDLKRVKMDRADACLVLADKHSSDPEHEDACNIMRVISIKHYYPQTRVIIQILQTYSKTHLLNIPGWNWEIGDSIICLSELRLGFMAQSSLVPGLSTVLINLCSVTDNIQVDENSWWWHYLDSINNRLMTSVLSNAFVGMSFNEVCRVCFIQMNIVLVAIEYRSNSGVSILVNPRAQVKLQENTVGFFIARSSCEVQRSSVYCTVCHNDISNPLLIKKCACKSPSPCASSERIMLTPVKSLDKLSLSDIRHLASETDEEGQTALDSTGMFHWCKEVPLEKAVLTHKAAVYKNFHNHIVVSVFGDSNSTLIGLRDFVMPLRASNLTYDELKPIVFLGPLNYLEREWKYIENFPQLFVFPGSGLSSVNLRSVNIHSCSMCAIISSIWTGKTTQYMEDTECILSTIKMRSMIPEATAADSDLLCLSDQKKPAPRIPVITELSKSF